MGLHHLLDIQDLRDRGVEYQKLELLRLEEQGRFPRRVLLGPKSPRWVAEEVDDYLRVKPKRSWIGVAGMVEIDIPNARSGVYFLLWQGHLQYIGQSVNVTARLSTHVKEDRKLFDAAHFLSAEPSELDRIEGALIRHFRPPLNHSATGVLCAPHRESIHADLDTLQALGLVQQTQAAE